MALPIIDIKDTSKLAEAIEKGFGFRIKHGKKIFIAYDEAEEKEIQESLARAREDIKAGRVFTSEEFFAHAHAKLESLRPGSRT